jgi:hypothetical protein
MLVERGREELFDPLIEAHEKPRMVGKPFELILTRKDRRAAMGSVHGQ